MQDHIARVEQAIKDLRAGKMIILTDHPERENEGDLIIPAETITTEKMNFIIRNTSGIVCLALTEDKVAELKLPLMVPDELNTSQCTTPFTVSIDAKTGITTGVSAADRVRTVQLVTDDKVTAADLVTPGHMFPLRAKKGGVLERAGHTEGAIDICKLAGFKPIAVLCEIMDADGNMSRGGALKKFAEQYDLTVLSIEDIIDYRLTYENMVAESASAQLPLEFYGSFIINIVKEKFNKKEHLVLRKEKFNAEHPPLVRIHSACMTGDLFGSERCDCKQQLHFSLKKISEEGGVLIYLNQEGRGIGLLDKIKAYGLQEKGFDTVDANVELGWSADMRKYNIAAQILRDLDMLNIRLLTNNPHKISDLKKYGISEIVRVPIEIPSNPFNENYLLTKQKKLNHNFMSILGDLQESTG
jgi:3,4-dihydroxy 2-butanone 4-phosphate synthase/GTP cyclohydrolase II